MVESQKYFVRGTLVIGTIAVMVFSVLLFLNLFDDIKRVPKTMAGKAILVAFFVGALIFEWFRYIQQSRKYAGSKNKSETLYGVNKIEGVYTKTQGILSFVFGIVLVIFGIYLAFSLFSSGSGIWYIGLLIILAGILFLILTFYFYLWRSKSLSEGRYY